MLQIMDRLGNIAARHNIIKETRMSTLPQPFSAAGNAQFAAQLQLFQTFTSQAVATTGKIISLNLNTARASLEQSTDALRQVLAAEDPRDLLALTTRSQASFESMLAYGRALVGIATGVQAPAPRQETAPTLAAPTAAPELAPEPAPEPVAAVAVVEAVTLPVPAEAAPVKAAAKAVAKAVAKTTPKTTAAKPAAAPFPVADGKPVKVKITGLKTAEARKLAAPIPPAAQLEMLAAAPKKKK
jgi:phasin family protein